MTDSEGQFDVVWPAGRVAGARVGVQEGLDTLTGKRIALVWDHLFKGDEILSALEQRLRASFDGIEFIEHTEFVGDFENDYTTFDTLGTQIADSGADAAVIAVGACGRCTTAVMRAVQASETVNVPAVAVISSGFEQMARSLSAILGDGDPRLAVYPGAIQTDTQEAFDEKVDQVVVGQIEKALLQMKTGSSTERVDAPDPRGVVVSGTLDEIEEHFIAQGWSDGLPIVPPTVDRIERFLAHTDLDPATVLGVIPPEQRELTIWNIAANAVMAGCRPEYMPVLIAIGECLVDPGFRIEDFTSTFGLEPMVVVSGPVVTDLNFNSGIGAMRLGRQSNTSIGRFTRLLLRNLGGLRIPPGETDAGAIGYSFNVVMAENEEATRAIAWPSFRVDNGFAPEESTVSVLIVTNHSAPIYTAGETAEDHLETIARVVGNAIGPWAYTSQVHGGFNPLILMSPIVAGALAGFGYDKDRIRHWLYDHLYIQAGITEKYTQQVGRTDFSFDKFVEGTKYRALYVASNDPERLVPMLMDPDYTSIVVGGNPGRNQSRAYIGNLTAGPPVSRAIRWPGPAL